MRGKGLWWLLLLCTASALLTYAVGKPIARGLYQLFIAFGQGVQVLLALPQLLWWLTAAMVLLMGGIYASLRWAMKTMMQRKTYPPAGRYKGRVSALRDSIFHANQGRYSQFSSLRYTLFNLATDLTALKSGVPESEARKRLHQDTWTNDELLKTYVRQLWSFEPKREKKFLRRWFTQESYPTFLQETREVLDRLKNYRDSIEIRDEHEHSGSHT